MAGGTDASEGVGRLPPILASRLDGIRNHYLYHSVRGGIRLYLSDNLTKFFLGLFVVILLLFFFGPMITPYDYDRIVHDEEGQIKSLAPPSSEHLLGTTVNGRDIFSRLAYGARPTLLLGFTSGILIVAIGLLVGVTAGYYGGRVDSLLMRATDFLYGVPILPTAIVFIAFFGLGTWAIVLLIGLTLWNTNARVFRSQVLQIKEREHVEAAELLGASDRYVIIRHILPNMGGMVMLFFAMGIGISILIAAGLAFIGFMNPFIPSWGIMLQNAYNSGYALRAWWWTLSPGMAISITVLTVYMLGRGYERVSEYDAEGG